ncbi:MAG: DUF29 domain-containing protein [Methylomicrobium sp.]
MTAYQQDVIAWSNEQANLLRAKRFELLDIEHLAEEIEDVGKSEQREFEHRMALLLAHLLKWQYQPARRGSSWQRTIKDQRIMITRRLTKTPSLKPLLDNPDFWLEAWADAALIAENETGILNVFPETCPWSFTQIMNPEFWPES